MNLGCSLCRKWVNLLVAVCYDGPMDTTTEGFFGHILEAFPASALGCGLKMNGRVSSWMIGKARVSFASYRLMLGDMSLTIMLVDKGKGYVSAFICPPDEGSWGDWSDISWFLSSTIFRQAHSRYLRLRSPEPHRPEIVVGRLPDCYLPPAPVGVTL